MKRLLTLLALTCATAASFAATLNPVQLLNPAGSTAGQAVVSTGASTAPAWGNVMAAALAVQAANTVVANVTGSSASPTAFAMPSCNATGNNLQWTAGTGFTCATGYALLASPTFTGTVTTAALTAIGLITPSSTVGIKGTPTNDNAQAGSIGEFVSATVLPGSALSLTTAVAKDVTSISLTAGDWDVRGSVWFRPGSTTTSNQNIGWISTTSATPPIFPNNGAGWSSTSAIGTGVGDYGYSVGTIRLSLASTTTVFLSAFSNFAVSTNSTYGFIAARRVR